MKKMTIAFCVSLLTPILFLSCMFGGKENNFSSNNSFNDEVTADLPIDLSIKRVRDFPDSISQRTQCACESAEDMSDSAIQDNNYFGITLFINCIFNKRIQNGIEGSDGDHYMSFTPLIDCFNYSDYMLAKQSNFNEDLIKINPSDVSLIHRKDDYTAADINRSNPYCTSCLQIIESDQLTSSDDNATQKVDNDTSSTSKGNSSILESQLGISLNGGECYGLTAYYVSQLGGPQLMGSGFINACDIGQDYDWSAYDYEVLFNPSSSEVKDGDIVNFKAGYGFSIPYGHTGVAVSSTDNSVTVYDQWNGQCVTTSVYSRPLSSIVRKIN